MALEEEVGELFFRFFSFFFLSSSSSTSITTKTKNALHAKLPPPPLRARPPTLSLFLFQLFLS